MGSLGLGDTLPDVFILGYLARLEEVLIRPGHLQQVLTLELVDYALFVPLGPELFRVGDRLPDGLSDDLQRGVLVLHCHGVLLLLTARRQLKMDIM